MATVIISWILRAAGLYALAGLIFAVAFVLRGAERIDPDARGATRGFRLIIIPGVVALWPYLAARWMRGATAPPVECNAHRRTAARTPHSPGAGGGTA